MARVDDNLVEELRALIVSAAPETLDVDAVLSCPDSVPLDELMRFSSLTLLGVVVAAEDRFGIAITRRDIEAVAAEGTTLRSLARMVERLREREQARR
jgi:acyl carrier protein